MNRRKAKKAYRKRRALSYIAMFKTCGILRLADAYARNAKVMQQIKDHLDRAGGARQ